MVSLEIRILLAILLFLDFILAIFYNYYMTKPIYEARNALSHLVSIAEDGEPVELTRYNKPVAVIISYEEYAKHNGGNQFWLDSWRNTYASYLDDEGIPEGPKVYPSINRAVFDD